MRVPHGEQKVSMKGLWHFPKQERLQRRWLWGTWGMVLGWAASCAPDNSPPLFSTLGSGGTFEVTGGLDECDSICLDETDSHYEYPEEEPLSCADLPSDLLLEPPCTQSDLIIEGGCQNLYAWGNILWPLPQVAVPSVPHLRPVLLAVGGIDDPDGQGGQGGQNGQGGEGSSQAWRELTFGIVPPRSAEVTASGFQLLQPGASLQVDLSAALTDPAFAPYVQRPFSSLVPWREYFVFHLALVHEGDVVLQQRAILQPGYDCIVR